MEEEKTQKVEKKVEKKVDEVEEEEDDCFEEFLFNEHQEEEIVLPVNNNQIKYWEEQWGDDEKTDLLQNLKTELAKAKA